MFIHSIRPLLLGLSVCLLATSAPLMAAVSYTVGEWKNISPSAVNINDKFGCNDIRIDPSNPNILYTCWDEQGMHKSTDGGNTWARIGLRVNPNNGQQLYAVQGVRGEAMGFWVSNNGGANWTRPQGFTDLANNIGVNRNDGGK